MESLNKQFRQWMIEKRLVQKWENEISPPPTQESDGDFRDEEQHPRALRKDKRPYPHTHQTIRAEVPGEYFLGHKKIKKHITPNAPHKHPGRGAVFSSLHGKTFKTRDEARKAFKEHGFSEPDFGRLWQHPKHGQIKIVYNPNTNKYVAHHFPPALKTMQKGLRGPKKGSKYKKLGAKDYLADEPEVSQETTPAIRDYYHARSPEAFKKVVAEMRAKEPKETNWGAWGTDIKGFKHEPLKFAKAIRKRMIKALDIEKHNTPKPHEHPGKSRIHWNIPGKHPLERKSYKSIAGAEQALKSIGGEFLTQHSSGMKIYEHPQYGIFTINPPNKSWQGFEIRHFGKWQP
ncbi:hypothetical protein HYS50_03370 [Candidatus Woesearchaeota archaeon]|nr:hypothetical protein [Candidatus Woesearchaeota archaeon]